MLGILVGILILGFLVATHELGHLFFAKLFHVNVPEYSIGMGPKLCGRKWGSTMYSLRLVPIGGFCAMEGEDGESDNPSAFCNKKLLERILIVAGGPLFNLITALILAVVLVFNVGANTPFVYTTTDLIDSGLEQGDVVMSVNGSKIHTGLDLAAYEVGNGIPEEVTVTFFRDGEVMSSTYQTSYSRPMLGVSYSIMSGAEPELTVKADSAAELAGLKTGDVVMAVDGVSVTSGEELKDTFDLLDLSTGRPVRIDVKRGRDARSFSVVPAIVDGRDFGFSATGFRDNTQGFGPKLLYSLREVAGWEKVTVASLKSLFTGQSKLSDMSGPVGIVSTVSGVVEEGQDEGDSDALYKTAMNLVNITILLAVNLGIMNLLPIPALDGGRLAFLFLEAVRRKRVKPEIERVIHAVGLGLLLLLMGFIMVQDAIRMMF